MHTRNGVQESRSTRLIIYHGKIAPILSCAGEFLRSEQLLISFTNRWVKDHQEIESDSA